MAKALDPKDVWRLRRFNRALNVLLNLKKDMKLPTAMALIAVACQEGKSQKEYEEQIGIAQSTGSRYFNALGDWESKSSSGVRNPGLSLIEVRKDWGDSGSKNPQYLTRAGVDVITEIVERLKLSDEKEE